MGECRYTSGKNPGTYLIGACVGPRACWTFWRRKYLTLDGIRTHDRLNHSVVAIPTALLRLLDVWKICCPCIEWQGDFDELRWMWDIKLTSAYFFNVPAFCLLPQGPCAACNWSSVPINIHTPGCSVCETPHPKLWCDRLIETEF